MRPKSLIPVLAFLAAVSFCCAQSAENRTVQPEHNVQYGRLPLMFEANRGQTNPQAQFLVRGAGYTAFLTTDGIVLSLRARETQLSEPGPRISEPAQTGRQNDIVQIRLQGAAANPVATGEDVQPGVVNYFIGKDPGKWRTNVPTYGRVRYKNIYPGIDLVYHGNHQQLEYDFELKPGANPELIQFEIQGASSITLDDAGNLNLMVHDKVLQVQCPAVYQSSNGIRSQISGKYLIKDEAHVAFNVAQYDRNRPLVIDPVLVYASYLGGSGTEVPGSTTVDGSGYLYLTGYTNSVDFPLANLGSLTPNANHVFVSKLDPTGTNLIYTDLLGGNGEDYGFALVLDNTNGVFVTGSTSSTNFPIVNGYQSQRPGPYTGFLSHISQDGSSLLYSTYLGGSTFDQPTGIAVNQTGQVYIAGYTMSRDFPVANAYQGSASANQGGVYGTYGFVTKFTQDGSSLVYSTYLAGSSTFVQTCGSTPCWPQPYSVISTLSVDGNDSAYVAGITNTFNFPTTASSYLPSNSLSSNAYIGFVTKLGSAGAPAYSTYFYSSSGNPVSIASIAVDRTGSAYVTGSADSDGTFPITTTSICDPGVYGFGCSYAFVTKFDPTAATLLYSTFLGPNNYATPQTILLDSMNDAYVAASTSSPQFQTTNPIEGYTNGLDVLLVEISPDATTQLFSTYLGGSNDETPSGMALDTTENVYIAGSTNSADFPVTQGSFQTQYAGNTDAFLAKIFTGTSPLISVNPATLQFAAQALGSTSQPLTVQLSNQSPLQLTLGSIAVTGDFSQTNNCGNAIAANASCSVFVTFTPTAVGSRTGTLTINDNASGSPQVVSLQGTGSGALAVLSPSALSFPSTQLGSASLPQSVTLTNQGNVTLNITNVQTIGDFTQSNNCPANLSAGSQCTLQVVFSPKATGNRSGSLTVNDNAAGSPQVISLQGAGVGLPAANFSPSNLAFPTTQLGSSSASQSVTLSNQGTAPLNITNIQVIGDFTQTTNCPSSLNTGSQCAFQVVFSPTATGNRTGSLVVSDSAQGSPQSVPLSGAGVDFNMTASPTTVSVSAGSTATYTLQVTSVGGAFGSTVSFACSQVPRQATCTASPSSAAPGAKGAAITVTIATAGSSSAAMGSLFGGQKIYGTWMQFQSLSFLGMLIIAGKRGRKRWLATIVLALAIPLLLCALGCAGGTGIAQQNNGKTPPGTYTILVSGTSGALKHSASLTLIVQ